MSKHTDAPSRETLFFPHLLIFRNLLAFFLVLSAVTQSKSYSDVLLRIAALIPPFLLFLSAFIHTYFDRASDSGSFLFYLRRFSLMFPLYLVVNIMHFCFFAPERTSISVALANAFALTPLLPASLSYPPQNSPTLAPLFIPCLMVAYLLLPAILSVLPSPSPRNLPVLLLLFFCAYILCLAEGVWLSSHTVSEPRLFRLLDLFVFPLFVFHLPSVILGAILALIHRSQRRIPTRTYSVVVASLSVVLLFLFYRLTLDLTPPVLSPHGKTPVLAACSITGLLHLIFALLVIQLANLPMSTTSRLRQNVSTTTSVSVAIYLMALPVYRSLRFVICDSKWNRLGSMCIPPASASLIPKLPPSMSYLHYVAERILHVYTLSGDSVPLVLYLPVLVIISTIVHALFVRPFAALIERSYHRLHGLAEEGRLSWSFLARFMLYLSSHPAHVQPNRCRPFRERLLRRAIFYVFAVAFLAITFRLASPAHVPTKEVPLLNVLCMLPHVIYNCHKTENDIFMRRYFASPKALTVIADYCRWLAFLVLPTMIFNLFGQFLFPRTVWSSFPTISSTLSSSSSNNQHQNTISEVRSSGFNIYFRYVTRGSNHRLVIQNVFRARDILESAQLPRSRWRVEVVTDKCMNLADTILDSNLDEIVVPNSYSPPSGAMFKARALNYAISASKAREKDWIVHLDEETRFDEDCVRAILHHCSKESYLAFEKNSQEWPSIGQGPILFGRSLTDRGLAPSNALTGNWMTTLADSGRVADDCGRFRLQYECGEAWLGMHGSFVVVCNNVEALVTYDHGKAGSIAEDAFFAMTARSKGVCFRWIDAFMFEQSPFNMLDFMKQRARWLVGVGLVVTDRRIPLHLRAFMGVLTFLWSLMPLIYLSFIISALFGSSEGVGGFWYHYLLVPTLACLSLWHYLFGFLVTFSIWQLGVIRFLFLAYLQLALSPVWGLMEMASVVYALTNLQKVSRGFHIVKKELPAPEQCTKGTILAECTPLV